MSGEAEISLFLAEMREETYLGVEEVEDDHGRGKHCTPDVDRLDSEVTGVGADHVGDTPLEDNTMRTKGLAL